MTPSLVSESAAEGVTHRCRSRRSPQSSARAASGAGSAPRGYLPPTVEEVGRAAALCFQDTHSDEQIARQLGIVRRTLARWKKRPDFAAAIAALQAWQEVEHEASEMRSGRR
jgi:hypothetical protein